MTARLKPFAVVFILAAAARLVWLDVPYVEPFNNHSRQAMCASVARNFYQHGFNLFYPEIDSGTGPYLYNVEFPLYSYFMALGYVLAGGVREGAARGVSVFFSLLLIVFFYRLTRRLIAPRAAVFGAAFLAFSPLVVALSRSIQPDITMTAAGVGALYFFHRYERRRRLRDLGMSALLLWFAVLTKVVALHLVWPLFYMAWTSRRQNMWRHGPYYLYAAFVLTALTWYAAMWWIGRTQPLYYQPYEYAPEEFKKQFEYWRLFTPAYLKLPLKVLLVHILTPAGLIGLAAGLAPGRGRPKIPAVLWTWFVAAIFYLLVMWSTAVSHPYYFLPLVPPLAAIIGGGWERLRQGPAPRRFFGKKTLLLALAAAQVVWCGYFYRLLYFIPPERRAIVEAGRAVDRLIPKDALVAASFGGSPIQLYYCNRKGWPFGLLEPDKELIERLERLTSRGASYFVTTRLDQLSDRPVFNRYLRERARVLEENAAFLVMDIRGSVTSNDY